MGHWGCSHSLGHRGQAHQTNSDKRPLHTRTSASHWRLGRDLICAPTHITPRHAGAHRGPLVPWPRRPRSTDNPGPEKGVQEAAIPALCSLQPAVNSIDRQSNPCGLTCLARWWAPQSCPSQGTIPGPCPAQPPGISVFPESASPPLPPPPSPRLPALPGFFEHQAWRRCLAQRRPPVTLLEAELIHLQGWRALHPLSPSQLAALHKGSASPPRPWAARQQSPVSPGPGAHMRVHPPPKVQHQLSKSPTTC